MKNILNRSQSKNTRIGCSDDFSHTCLVDLIEVMRTKLVDVHITSICANSNLLRQYLDAGELDMTIITRARAAMKACYCYKSKEFGCVVIPNCDTKGLYHWHC